MTANNEDTTPPVVALTSPAQNAKLSGRVTLGALAGDDHELRDVQFVVDGQKIGLAVAAPPSSTAAPFLKDWNTTDVTDGTHLLTAVASDNAGLSATSAPRSVIVDNPDPPPTDSVPPIPQPEAEPSTEGATDSDTGSSGPISPNHAPAISRLKLSRATLRKGGDDEDQLPPQRGGQGEAVLRAQARAATGRADAA